MFIASAPPVELNVGDEVAHIRLGDGLITSIDDKGVHVAYSKNGCQGLYDQKWFEMYPNYLFKVSKP